MINQINQIVLPNCDLESGIRCQLKSSWNTHSFLPKILSARWCSSQAISFRFESIEDGFEAFAGWMVCFYCSSLIQGLQGGDPAEAFGCTGRGWGQHFWESDCYLTWVFSCLTLLYWEVQHPVEASGCTGRLGRGRAAQHPPRQPRPPLTPHTPQLDPP